MADRRVRALQFAAVQVVGAVAVVHFAVGTEQLAGIAANGLLVEYLTGRVLDRPRALLFVVSSVAALAGLVAAGLGHLDRRTAYRLGIALLSTYLVGWLAWHTVLDHGLALSEGRVAAGAAHSHGGLLATVRSHYLDPLVATLAAAGSGTPGSGRTLLGVVSVTLELVGIGLLAVLLRLDPAARGGSDRGGSGLASWLRFERPGGPGDGPEDGEPDSE